jgi:predicted RND superfamily exporter protein
VAEGERGHYIPSVPGPSPLDPRWFAFAAALALGGLLWATALRPAWVLRRPRTLLVALGLFTALAASALFHVSPLRSALKVDPSTEPLLPAGDAAQELYRSAVLDFGDDEIFAIAVQCEAVFTPPCLHALERAGDRIARLPGVRSVTSLLDVTSFRWVPEDEWIEVRPFIEEVPSDPARLAELRERALSDPVYRRTLVSDDARTAALNVSFREMTDAELIAADLDGKIDSILREELGDRFPYHVAGRPHLKTRVYHGMMGDLAHLIPASIAVVGLVLWVATGALRGVLLPLGTALIAVLWTFAAVALLGRPLTLLTGLLGPTLLAIGSVYGVHVLARYEEEAQHAPDARSAVRACLEHVLRPVLISGATTVLGFAALLVTDVPAVFELGAFAMLGVGSVTLLSLTFVPAALVLLRPRARYDHPLDRPIDGLLAALSHVIRRRSGAVIGCAAVALVVAGVALPRIEIDTDYLSYFDPDDPVRVDFEAVNRLLAGAVPLYVVLDGEGPGAFREPEVLRAIESLEHRIDRIPGVSRTLSFVDSLRVLNRAFHADEPGQERVPDTRPGVSELLFMIPKNELQRFTTVNHGRANLIVRTGEVGSAAIERLCAALERAIREQPLPQGVRARVTGNALLLARSADGIARGQPLTIAIASVSIFALVALGLGSLRLGAVAMIPNLAPVLLFFGLLGFGAAPLSLPTSLIGSVALGIAIDDTVHFIARYRDERARGKEPEQAALDCGRHVGRPIFITSVMLFLGFLVMLFSEFATLRQFGLLSAVTMAICLVADLVLLPAILVRWRI